MYRPLRDLNGIPRAKNITMCLTGYQRQDRDDIMVNVARFVSFHEHLGMKSLWVFYFLSQTMVGLMGAHFSKPLVANKVTHLICYKFEGVVLIFTY
jgi:topoisomerase (DNA) II binding protein 1